jgi:serine/threonine protein kinase
VVDPTVCRRGDPRRWGWRRPCKGDGWTSINDVARRLAFIRPVHRPEDFMLNGHAPQSHADDADAVTLQLAPGRRPTLAYVAPPPMAMPEPPPQLGDYTVLGPLARGGMCGVYLGQHRHTGERVALKLLDPRWLDSPGAVTRLLGEYALRRRIHHDGVVAIRAAHLSPDGQPYLVMELLDGEDLGALLERGRLTIGATAALGAQVADAAAALHAADIIHCDLKPENIMLLYRDGLAGWPEAKLLDLGVARERGVALPEVAGTPAYMAPEQWQGRPSAASDVYALGCTLYELLTGVAPFEGTVLEVRLAHLEAQPAPASHRRALPASLDHLILRSLAKEPRLRPRMSELTSALTDLAFAHPPGARAEGVLAAVA